MEGVSGDHPGGKALARARHGPTIWAKPTLLASRTCEGKGRAVLANRPAALADRGDLGLHLLVVLRAEHHFVAEHEGGRAAQVENLAQAVGIDERRLDEITVRILVE